MAPSKRPLRFYTITIHPKQQNIQWKELEEHPKKRQEAEEK